jgi:hypothetical protein
MSATEVMDQVKQLPLEEQRKLFVLLAEKIMVDQGEGSKRWFGKKLSFEEACNVVFRENRELLEMLAK